MSHIPAVQVRLDMINGMFDLDEPTTLFMKFARSKISDLAKELVDAAPSTVDVGRLIATIDALQAAKDVVCAAAILGKETDSRKKRKAAEVDAPEASAVAVDEGDENTEDDAEKKD